MTATKFTPLELQIMDALWKGGKLAIREIQESFAETDRPAYTTIQTTVYRLEEKGAVRRVRKISNAHIFEAVTSREVAGRKLIDELFSLFDGQTQPVMAHLVATGKVTMDDVRAAEQLIERLGKKK